GTENCTYQVTYKPANYSCVVSGSLTPGHTILQPVNADGTSVFKQGSTVPLKFMVFDANCNSVGTAGVVTGMTLTASIPGTPGAATTPEPSRRRSRSCSVRSRSVLPRLFSIFLLLPPLFLRAQPGALDKSFDPGTGVDQSVYSIAVQTNGSILIAGNFTSFNS